MPASALDVLLTTLRLHGYRDSGESDALRGTAVRYRQVAKGETIVTAGPAPHESCLILDGFASREVVLRGGSRQLASCYLKGDFVDLYSFVLDELDHNIIALTNLSVAFFAHRDLKAVCERFEGFERLLWRLTAVDAAIQRVWLTNNSRRPSTQRLAHFLCEQNVRLGVQGLASEGRFQLPVAQAAVADILGLSVVQMNRSTQELRRNHLITWKGADIAIEPQALASFSDFDPAYLNLDRRRWTPPEQAGDAPATPEAAE